MDHEKDTFDVTRGDVGLSKYLRDSLEKIRSSSVADSGLRSRLDDVLAGRTSLREVGMSDDFARALDRISARPLEQVTAMPEQERTRLAEQAEAELEQLGRQADGLSIAPGARQPNPDEVFISDDPDQDDAYYQDRRQHGWLV